MPELSVPNERVDRQGERLLDRAELLDRLGGDEELMAEVIDVFLSDCPVQLAAINAAVDQRDAKRIRTAAHALKGAAGNMSALRLAQAVAALELSGAEGQIKATDDLRRHVAVEASLLMHALRQIKNARAEGSS